MGAHNITTTSMGVSMADAYRNAVDDALYEEGHNSYNGTISTTDGFIDKTNEYKKDPENWDEKAEDATEKWGAVWGAETETGKYRFTGWASC